MAFLLRILIFLLGFLLLRRTLRGFLTRLNPQPRPPRSADDKAENPSKRPFDESEIEEADYEDIP